MEYVSLIGTIFIAHTIGLISPGPDFFMVVKNSLKYSRKAGTLTAIGVGMGISIHMFYCLAGIALVITKSQIVFNSIKVLGAIYLLYIAYNSFFTKSEKIKIDNGRSNSEISNKKAFRQGFITNVLNPKATLFFLSLFTFVVSPDTPNFILGIIASMLVLITMLWFVLVSFFFTNATFRAVFEKYQPIINKLFGVILLGLAIQMIYSIF